MNIHSLHFILQKKVKEVSWLENFLESSKQTKSKRITKITGISKFENRKCVLLCYLMASNSFAIHAASYTPSSLTLRVDNGVDYAMFPTEGKRWCGFAKMGPRSFKQTSRSTSTVVRASGRFFLLNFLYLFLLITLFVASFLQHLTVLVGKVQLSADKCTKDFECGSMITIPKGKFNEINLFGERNEDTLCEPNVTE